jgi:WD40-like Beta Propeller Repeat
MLCVFPVAAVAASASSARVDACPSAVRGFGSVVLAPGGQLQVLRLSSCSVRNLHQGGVFELSVSPDGLWIAFTRLGATSLSGPYVISINGGKVYTPLGVNLEDWSWGTHGHLLYGVNSEGTLIAQAPSGKRRTIPPPGTSLGVSPTGNLLAVSNSKCGTVNSPATGELDTITLFSGARKLVLHRNSAFFVFASWSPDQQWLLFWHEQMCSASLQDDGMPLQAVAASGGSPVPVVPVTLVYQDYLTWCSNRLIAVAGSGRQSNLDKSLVAASPPTWHVVTVVPSRARSWVSPACSPSGSVLAAAAGPNQPNPLTPPRRSIWLMAPNGSGLRRLTNPPGNAFTDESPQWSTNGQWIMFLRAKLTANSSAVSGGTIELVKANGATQPIPILTFTGSVYDFYDHLSWPNTSDWYQPPHE